MVKERDIINNNISSSIISDGNIKNLSINIKKQKLNSKTDFSSTKTRLAFTQLG